MCVCVCMFACMCVYACVHVCMFVCLSHVPSSMQNTGGKEGIPLLAAVGCRGGHYCSVPTVYQYKIQHIAGTEINLADCMSRLPSLLDKRE